MAKSRKERDFLTSFLSSAEGVQTKERAQGPHTATNARSAVQAAEAEGKLPVLPFKVKPRGPLQRFRSPHVG
jgi:hypothetical protein